MARMTLAKRNTQAERARERREAEEEKKLRRKKLTPKEQEELEEKEFEEACERWIGKIIRVVSHAGVQPRTGRPQAGPPLIHLRRRRLFDLWQLERRAYIREDLRRLYGEERCGPPAKKGNAGYRILVEG